MSNRDESSSPQPSAAATAPGCASPVEQALPPTRRNAVVDLLTATLSFLLVAVPSTIGGLFFLDPLLRRRSSAKQSGTGAGEVSRKDDEGFIRLEVTSNVIPADGTPFAVTVRDDSDDAWNRFVDVPVGSIWLRRNPHGTVLAFNSVCPHLGCSVNFRRSENDFFCPCHTSAFALDGRKTNEVPPRDMDTLQVAIRSDGRDDPGGSEIWVKFQNFRRASPDNFTL